MKASTKANGILLLVTIIWGMTFPLMHQAVSVIPAADFVFFRFALAAIPFIPCLFRSAWSEHKTIFFPAFIIGALFNLSYMTQTIGLVTISAARSAFIAGLSVVFVPLLMPFFRMGTPNITDFIGAFLSLIGVYILTGADLHGIGMGDLLSIFSAFIYAVGLLFVQHFSARTHKPALFAFYQIFFPLPFAFCFFSKTNWELFFHPSVLMALLFTGFLATSFVFYLQMRYQGDTTPTKAALIYALEPFFAALFAYLIEREAITYWTIGGGALILVSILLQDIVQFYRGYREASCSSKS